MTLPFAAADRSDAMSARAHGGSRGCAGQRDGAILLEQKAPRFATRFDPRSPPSSRKIAQLILEHIRKQRSDGTSARGESRRRHSRMEAPVLAGSIAAITDARDTGRKRQWTRRPSTAVPVSFSTRVMSSASMSTREDMLEAVEAAANGPCWCGHRAAGRVVHDRPRKGPASPADERFGHEAANRSRSRPRTTSL